jgi:hypothetical protein
LSIEPTGKRHRYGTLVVDLRDAASMESIPCAFRLDAVGGGVAYTDLESGVARIVRVGSYRLTPLSPVLSRLISTTEVEVEAQSPTRVALRTSSPLRELRLRVEDEWGSMIGPFQLSLNAHGGAMDATLQVAQSDARELRSYWIPVARVDLSVEARGFEPQEVTIRESEDLSAPYLVRLKVDG